MVVYGWLDISWCQSTGKEQAACAVPPQYRRQSRRFLPVLTLYVSTRVPRNAHPNVTNLKLVLYSLPFRFCCWKIMFFLPIIASHSEDPERNQNKELSGNAIDKTGMVFNKTIRDRIYWSGTLSLWQRALKVGFDCVTVSIPIRSKYLIRIYLVCYIFAGLFSWIFAANCNANISKDRGRGEIGELCRLLQLSTLTRRRFPNYSL